MSTKIPATVRALFWSSPNKLPDLKKDAPEIVHKVFAFGDIDDIRWLKKTYKQQTLRQLFQKKPLAVYTPAAFHFASSVILHFNQSALNKSHYVKAVY